MKISECIAPENVEIDLKAPSKAGLLQILAAKAGRAVGIDDREILAALLRREKLGSTGIGGGVAIPHAPVARLKKSFALIARLGKPMEFDSIDGAPVDIVCLVLSPPEGGGSHLTVLSRIARLLRMADVLKKVRAAKSGAHIYAIVTEADG